MTILYLKTRLYRRLLSKLKLSYHGAWLLVTIMFGFCLGIALVGLFVELIPIIK